VRFTILWYDSLPETQYLNRAPDATVVEGTESCPGSFDHWTKGTSVQDLLTETRDRSPSRGGKMSADNGSLALSMLGLLIPLGLALVAAGGVPEKRAGSVALSSLAAMGLGGLAYLAVGFALQFGGVGLHYDLPGLEGLIWERPLFTASDLARVGSSGYFLQDAAATPAAYRLFLAQLPLVATATLIPLAALRGRTRGWVPFLGALLTGGLLYPLLAHWAWFDDWLAQLGQRLGLGHGYVDLAGAGVVHVLGGAVALAGLLAFRLQNERPSRTTLGPDSRQRPLPKMPRPQKYVPLPPTHQPLLAYVGAMLAFVGWTGLMLQWPPFGQPGLDPGLTILNLTLCTGAAGTLGMFYTWLVAGAPSPLMVARATVGGLVAVSAGAAFIPPWAAMATGAAVGLLIAPLHYLLTVALRLGDETAAISTHLIPGAWGVIVVGLLADGRFGAGWNAVGTLSYLGVPGQGVTGALAAPGFLPDWPGQLQAQLAGIGVLFVSGLIVAGALFALAAGFIAAWEGRHLPAEPETGADPRT
jgi:Amt family ammonium transporter